MNTGPTMKSDDKDTEVQYVEAQPVESVDSDVPEPEAPYAVVFHDQNFPCCSGCGCLMLAVAVLLLLNIGPVLSTLLVAIASAWLATGLLRVAGVHRFSPAYVYLLVPAFLLIANYLAALTHDGHPPMSYQAIAGAVLAIYAFLLLAGRVRR